MQITQERWEYDLTTNSVKFMQQTTSSLSEGDSSVCSWYPLQSIYLINCPKVKASNDNVHLWYKHKLADVYDILWCKLHQWLSAECGSPRYTSIIHCFSSLASRILFWALLHCFLNFIVTGFRPGLLRRPYISHDESFWCFTYNTPLKSAGIMICKFYKVV